MNIGDFGRFIPGFNELMKMIFFHPLVHSTCIYASSSGRKEWTLSRVVRWGGGRGVLGWGFFAPFKQRPQRNRGNIYVHVLVEK